MFSSEHKVVYYSDGLWSVFKEVQQKSALTVTGMVHGGFNIFMCVDDRSDRSMPHTQPMSHKGLSSDA